jgi:hypothetical protein
MAVLFNRAVYQCPLAASALDEKDVNAASSNAFISACGEHRA